MTNEGGGAGAETVGRPKVLVVDDEPSLLIVLERLLRKEGYDVMLAPDGETAIERCNAQKPDLVMSDLRMPGMSGLELLRRLRLHDPDLAFIILTGAASSQDVSTAIERGADDLIWKPFDFDVIRFAAARAVRAGKVRRELRALRQEREERRSRPDGAASRPTIEFLRIVSALSELREGVRDRPALHVEQLAVALGREMELGEPALDELSVCAHLYDIGKLGIPESLLVKREALTPNEIAVIRRHPTEGARMVRQTKALWPALPAVLHHHERWDGRGYPDGLREQQIPLPARILAVVDAFQAISSDRPYRSKRDAAAAMRELQREAGTQFDPEVVAAFHRVLQRGSELDAAGRHSAS